MICDKSHLMQQLTIRLDALTLQEYSECRREERQKPAF